MGICRGTSTRFQYCGKDIPKFGNYPNVCGASPAVFNPNVPRDSGVAMSRAKTRRVIGNTSTKYVRSVDPNQVVTAVQMRLGNQPYNGKRGERTLCAASRSGGVGKMFGHGRAKRCFNTGCVCGSGITDTPGNFSGATPDSSERTAAVAAIVDSLSTQVRSVTTVTGDSFGNNDYSQGILGNNSEGSCYGRTGTTVTRHVQSAAPWPQTNRLCNYTFNYTDTINTCPTNINPTSTAAGGCTIYFDNTFFSPASLAFSNQEWNTGPATTVTITSGAKTATVNILALKACEPGGLCSGQGVSHGTITARTGVFALTDNLSFSPDVGLGIFGDSGAGNVNFTAAGLALINSCP